MAKKKKPVKLITLDTETYNGLIGELKRRAIYDGERVTYGYAFPDVEPVLLEYSEPGYDVHIYIHNLEFDLRKLPDLLKPERVKWEKSFIINGKIATLACKKYTVHDSFKILPKSLYSLSHDFDVEHGKLDLWEEVQTRYPGEYSGLVDFLDRCPVDDELFLEYLGYDVISLYEILQKLIEISGHSQADCVGRIATSSLSRGLFKNGYKGKEFKDPLRMQTDYQIMTGYNWKKNLEVEEFIRASYCGGRTEVFKPRLNHKGFHYDVKSLYPSQFDKEYPIGKPEYFNDPDTAKFYFTRWLEDKIGLGFVSASVFIPQQDIPPLPCKMGKLVFPCGHVYGTWTFEELEYAIKNCRVEITEYYEVCFFSQTFPVFKRFKDTFYELKVQATEEKNESLRTLAKLILNVMYGYTGMTRDKTQLRPFSELADHDNIIYADEELGFIEVPADINAEYIQVQIASYVTSRARLVLLDALRKVSEVGNVYYCDTDSIVCDVPMPEEMVHHTKLGYWDLESEPERGVFLRPKVYAEMYPDSINVKFKGVTKETQKELTFDSYENLYTELEQMEKEYIVVEKNRLTMRSIMYIEKEGIDITDNRINDKKQGIKTGYEVRDKKMNLNTIEKRQMDYKENKTKPWYFESEQDFDSFSFNPPKKEVQFDMTGR